jgi:hypothetical protein
VRGEAWILDGDLGPYDSALDVRLRAADTIIVLNFAFLRCAWRSVLRGRERGDYWRRVWTYRRHSLPRIMRKIGQDAPHARLYVLRHPGMVRCLLAEIRPGAGSPVSEGNAGDPTLILIGSIMAGVARLCPRPDRLTNGRPMVTAVVRVMHQAAQHFSG